MQEYPARAPRTRRFSTDGLVRWLIGRLAPISGVHAQDHRAQVSRNQNEGERIRERSIRGLGVGLVILQAVYVGMVRG